jgi:hypothetical protein
VADQIYLVVMINLVMAFILVMFNSLAFMGMKDSDPYKHLMGLVMPLMINALITTGFALGATHPEVNIAGFLVFMFTYSFSWIFINT